MSTAGAAPRDGGGADIGWRGGAREIAGLLFTAVNPSIAVATMDKAFRRNIHPLCMPVALYAAEPVHD